MVYPVQMEESLHPLYRERLEHAFRALNQGNYVRNVALLSIQQHGRESAEIFESISNYIIEYPC